MFHKGVAKLQSCISLSSKSNRLQVVNYPLSTESHQRSSSQNRDDCNQAGSLVSLDYIHFWEKTCSEGPVIIYSICYATPPGGFIILILGLRGGGWRLLPGVKFNFKISPEMPRRVWGYSINIAYTKCLNEVRWIKNGL